MALNKEPFIIQIIDLIIDVLSNLRDLISVDSDVNFLSALHEVVKHEKAIKNADNLKDKVVGIANLIGSAISRPVKELAYNLKTKKEDQKDIKNLQAQIDHLKVVASTCRNAFRGKGKQSFGKGTSNIFIGHFNMTRKGFKKIRASTKKSFKKKADMKWPENTISSKKSYSQLKISYRNSSVKRISPSANPTNQSQIVLKTSTPSIPSSFSNFVTKSTPRPEVLQQQRNLFVVARQAPQAQPQKPNEEDRMLAKSGSEKLDFVPDISVVLQQVGELVPKPIPGELVQAAHHLSTPMNLTLAFP
jgi:hypothetical protein